MPESISFKFFSNIIEILYLIKHVIFNLFDCFLHSLFCCDKNICRVDYYLIEYFNSVSIYRVYGFNFFNFISPKDNTYCMITIGNKNIDCITLNPECSALKVNLIPGIKTVNQFPEKSITAGLFFFIYPNGITVKIFRIPNSIQTGNRRYDNNIFSSRKE
ncbi:hypothetical protein ES708_18610 [subsurface metagenome]